MPPNHLLIAAREQKGLTPYEIPLRLGIQTQLYERWEAGLAEPALPHLRQLCALFHQPPEVLGFAIYPLDPPPPGLSCNWRHGRNGALYRLRTQRKVSQRTMARQLGVAFETYRGWEHNRTRPSREHLSELCTFFACSPADLGYTDSTGRTQLLSDELTKVRQDAPGSILVNNLADS